MSHYITWELWISNTHENACLFVFFFVISHSVIVIQQNLSSVSEASIVWNCIIIYERHMKTKSDENVFHQHTTLFWPWYNIQPRDERFLHNLAFFFFLFSNFIAAIAVALGAFDVVRWWCCWFFFLLVSILFFL